jgi:hypothetical protein
MQKFAEAWHLLNSAMSHGYAEGKEIAFVWN